jgi:FAD/FMN-containing dehydrogenase
MTDMLAPLDPAALRPGLLIVPGDDAYDEVRPGWNLLPDLRPAAVALPTDADEVATLVRYAAERGLRVIAQATGHNASPLGDLSDVILIRTGLMRGVEIDADNRVARAEAGALWMDVVGPAAAHGLAALHGSAPDVGVVGYTLGGGVSWYSRRYGLASSRVLAIEAVTADGEQVRADREHHADLFWALRGGGGAFAIVTAIEFELFSVGDIQAGGLWFPVERASEVFNAWREWVADLPEHVGTSARILNLPPLPEIPESIRGKSFALVLVSVLGDEAEAARLLEPLRALGPAMDMVVPTAPEQLVELAMDPPNPMPGVAAHVAFDELTPEAVDAIVETVSASRTIAAAYVTLGGGASARPVPGGALTAMEAPFLFFCAGLALPEISDAAMAEMAAVEAALAPYASTSLCMNFTERTTDPVRFFGPEAAERLRAIKREVDPAGRIVSAHLS